MKNLKINTLLLFAVLLIVSIAVYSCQKESGDNTSHDQPHAVTIFLTDHQTPVFDSVFVDIQRLEIKVEDDSTQQEAWINMAIRPGIYNILRFRNGLDTLFATGTIPNARIRKIRLTLGTQNSAVVNSQSFPLRIKDEDRQVVVNLEAGQFDITQAGAVLFWIDFDAGNSIQVDNSGSGNNNGYRLRSHLRIFTRSQSGRIEGIVFPQVAAPIIKAVTGTDTATAIPGNNGEFKIVGLRAGRYTVIYDAQNGYRDTLISNVVVRNGEDTHLPIIILRQ